MNARTRSSSLLAHAAGFAIAAVVLLSPARAHADDAQDFQPIPGTVPYNVGVHARKTTDAIYNSVGVLERKIFPMMFEDDSETTGGLVYESIALYNIARVPTYLDPRYPKGGITGGNYLHSLDLYAASYSFGVRHKQFGVFGTLGMSGADMSAQNGWRAAWFGVAPVFFPVMAGLAAFGYDEWEKGPRGYLFDYSIGGSYSYEKTNFVLGYVGSRGVYTNISQSKIHAFLSALVANEFGDLAQVAGGFQRIPSDLGRTSLFARRRLWSIAPPLALDSFSALDKDAVKKPFTTIHLEHQWSWLFGSATMALQPEVSLYEGRAGVDFIYGGAYGALVNLPEMRYWGQAGGRRFAWSAFLALPEPENGFLIQFAVRRNDPEVLSIYPYGIDATSFYLSLEGGPGVQKQLRDRYRMIMGKDQ